MAYIKEYWQNKEQRATIAREHEPVSNKVLEKICKFFECSVNDIISYQ